MYCPYCGTNNSEVSKFCGNCGKPIEPNQVQTQAQPAIPNSPYYPAGQYIPGVNSPPAAVSIDLPHVGPKWASAGATIAILCFFMPWLMVSCSGISVKVSGWQLSTGTYGMKNQDVKAYPELFIILFLGLIGLIALNGKRSGAFTAVASGFLGIAGLIFFGANIISDQGIYVQVDYQAGYYGEWLGFLLMIIFGIWGSRNTNGKNHMDYPQGKVNPPPYQANPNQYSGQEYNQNGQTRT